MSDATDRAELRTALDASVARLVARAATEGWPIRADHCFLRIAYDNAVGDRWDRHHPRPAWRMLPLDAIRAATAIAASIEAGGLPVLIERNVRSLSLRRQSDGLPLGR